jgi:hypothetical protein
MHPIVTRILVLLITSGCIIASLSCNFERRRGVAARPAPAPATTNTAVPAAATAEPTKRFQELVKLGKSLGYTYRPAPPTELQKRGQIAERNFNCVACHQYDPDVEAGNMHKKAAVLVGCVDCHGGVSKAIGGLKAGISPSDPFYDSYKKIAHVESKKSSIWNNGSGNPIDPGASTLAESPDYIRFVNPGDLHAARVACAACHDKDPHYVSNTRKSMMAHGAMLWGAALYNNGSIKIKRPLYGESYRYEPELGMMTPQQLVQNPRPTDDEINTRGVLPFLSPLPRWEVTQPGNILRVFERGGKIRPITGIPNIAEDPGRPDVKLSVRGFGTDLRTDPVFIGLQKTRLLDPTLNFFGTNDHPGDYRSSGCSACHVPYANDRSPLHSAMWSKYGNRGESFSSDRTVNPSCTTQPTTNKPARQSGHPIRHQFVSQPSTSACIVCHIHPGTNVLNAYLGFQWWDNETDGRHMYPARQKDPDSRQQYKAYLKNPEGASARGLWSNLYTGEQSHAGEIAPPDFLENITRLNPVLRHTQFADFHGHGWVFRAVYKQDRRGNFLDAEGNIISEVSNAKLRDAVDHRWTPEKGHAPGNPVHLKDIHLEMGMQCVDCHFSDDNHGTGKLYGETRNATVIECVDCHGTVTDEANILKRLREPKSPDAAAWRARAFSGNAATTQSNQSALGRFKVDDKGRLLQQSAMDLEDKQAAKDAGIPQNWTVVQTKETVEPSGLKSPAAWTQKASFNTSNSTDEARHKRARSACYAHTVRKDLQWGNAEQPMLMAHQNMSCYSCHTSWNTSCFGCHLPMKANEMRPMLHNEGNVSRNYTNYNFQTLRDDVFMLGIDSTVKKGQVVPIRSACAVLVSSQNANREWLYTQQQTVSAGGFAGTAFSPYFPHTVRATESKRCTDCHPSADRDNNAIMAQLLLQGTNSVNFIGRFAWLACGHEGVHAVAVTEREEPQAVIGSRLHELAYPRNYEQHKQRNGRLTEAYEHHGSVLDVQLRGEYLYAACGSEGFIAYDVANIDNKGFSERIITAPVSPLGQRFYIKSKYATSICSPSTMAIDPSRPPLPDEDQNINPLYAYLYLTDHEEGLIVIGNPINDKKNKGGVATLLDGDPTNNFLKRAKTFNPKGLLKGARHMALYGTYGFISCDAGIVIINLEDPLNPKHFGTINEQHGIVEPKRIAFQFRYGFVCDKEGLKVIDVLEALGILEPNPAKPALVKSIIPLPDARDVYVSRTYAYVAAGRSGLLIADITKPEIPADARLFKTDSKESDAYGVRVGMTNTSMFAYVADGKNGLKVFQLTSADDTLGYLGFSPRPTPRLIAWHKTPGPALALSEGLDRDRAVDEFGNQLAVFGRRGARPFNWAEQQKLYLKKNEKGRGVPYYVTDEPTTDPLPPTTAPATTKTAPPSGKSKPGVPPRKPGVPPRP